MEVIKFVSWLVVWGKCFATSGHSVLGNRLQTSKLYFPQENRETIRIWLSPSFTKLPIMAIIIVWIGHFLSKQLAMQWRNQTPQSDGSGEASPHKHQFCQACSMEQVQLGSTTIVFICIVTTWDGRSSGEDKVGLPSHWRDGETCLHIAHDHFRGIGSLDLKMYTNIR